MAQIGLPGFGDFDVVWKLRFWSDHWYQNPNWDSGLIIDTKIILSHNLISIRLDANLGPPFVPKDLGCTLCMPYNAVWKLRFWSDHRHQNHIEPQYDFDTVGSKFRTSFCSERSGLYIVDHIMHNSKMKINAQCPGHLKSMSNISCTIRKWSQSHIDLNIAWKEGSIIDQIRLMAGHECLLNHVMVWLN